MERSTRGWRGYRRRARSALSGVTGLLYRTFHHTLAIALPVANANARLSRHRRRHQD